MPGEIFPYQDEGAAFLATKLRAGLFDEMGLGKTATIIRGLDRLGHRRGIIVCPAMLRENWRNEFAMWSHIPRRIIKAANIHDFVAWQKGRFDVLLASYEMMVKWSKFLHKECEIFEFMHFDEAHYMKNPKAGRTKALVGPGGASQWAEFSWWATGTAIPNDPAEIFTFLKFAAVMPLTEGAFIKRYFSSRQTTYGAKNKPRADMVPELRSLIANNSIRRMQADVGMQLPPIHLTSVMIDGDTHEIREMLAHHPGLEVMILKALENGELGLGASLKDGAQHIATLRRLIGEAKAIPYAHMLLHELHSGKAKQVVFGIHTKALRDVQDFLTRQGIWTVLVTGDTPEHARQAAVRDFQNDPRCRVFIGNIRAAGTGLTLTAAADLDMMESDWTPAGNAQAIKRVHRIGQSYTVRARFPTLASSFDETVVRIVVEKTKNIALVEGHEMLAIPLDPTAAAA